MTPDEPADDAAETPGGDTPGGVFGNLPRTRPGARSPRREAGAPKPRQAEARGASPAPEPDVPRDDPEHSPTPEPGGGIEDVAWAGVAAAAEAATIGVRLATRALEAMRDAVERR
jgi:hypothetical protein